MSRILKDAQNQITNGYSSSHKAVDVVKYKGQTCEVIAHTKGVVVWTQTGKKNNTSATGNASYGNCVKIKHPNGYYTLYAHLKNVRVEVGQKVNKGQSLGYMGDTGRAFKAHLHFEIRTDNNQRINPTPYLDSNLPDQTIKYQVYDNKKNKWLPMVTKGTSEYAGNFKNSISGLKISCLTYRVHDKVKNKWLPYVTGLESYAGNLPNDIDGVQIKEATYRVHIINSGWLPWVNKVDNTSNGYAGIFKKSIDAVQIK